MTTPPHEAWMDSFAEDHDRANQDFAQVCLESFTDALEKEDYTTARTIVADLRDIDPVGAGELNRQLIYKTAYKPIQTI